jgi:hypothetical protein
MGRLNLRAETHQRCRELIELQWIPGSPGTFKLGRRLILGLTKLLELDLGALSRGGQIRHPTPGLLQCLEKFLVHGVQLPARFFHHPTTLTSTVGSFSMPDRLHVEPQRLPYSQGSGVMACRLCRLIGESTERAEQVTGGIVLVGPLAGYEDGLWRRLIMNGHALESVCDGTVPSSV